LSNRISIKSINFRSQVPANRRHTLLRNLLKSRLYGQTRIQIEQSEFCPAQNRKHFSAFVVHFNTPRKFETLCASRDGSANVMAFGGQALLHR